ncbi:MFS family permease [Bradyrhizobium sp. USDA 4486]
MSTLHPALNTASATSIRTPAAPAAPVISAKTWIAVIGATLGAFMAVLNIQIVNASLADIQGAIGAGIDDGGWISTSYLIAEIVVIPLSGWLAQVFSIRIYLLTNAVLFLALSAACALAQDLPQMIVLRAVQGFTGGVLIPMAFTLIITLLPRAKQPVGLAMFALSATFAPAIGPTIGGYLTENFGWQYIFYVNLVPGAIMVGMLWYALEAKPMKLALLREGDWAGIVTMAIGLSALQTVLEEGNKDDWFGSPFIVKLSVIAAVALTAFLIIELTVKKPLLNLRPAGSPQFRLRHAGELSARHRALRLGVHPAAISVAHPGLQRRADRHGAGLDRIAAAPADSTGAASDAEVRRAHHHRHRLRAVRSVELHEHLYDQRLCGRPAVVA